MYIANRLFIFYFYYDQRCSRCICTSSGNGVVRLSESHVGLEALMSLIASFVVQEMWRRSRKTCFFLYTAESARQTVRYRLATLEKTCYGIFQTAGFWHAGTLGCSSLLLDMLFSGDMLSSRTSGIANEMPTYLHARSIYVSGLYATNILSLTRSSGQC
jgi:hypothetical protein